MKRCKASVYSGEAPKQTHTHTLTHTQHTQNQLSEAGKELALPQTKWHFIYVSH